MHIWVDADACPGVIKEILFRAADRVRLPLVRSVQVSRGFDVADGYILQQLETGDLVITADIPLAAEVIEKGGHAINPRGERYTPENVRQRLAMRDFMEEMRSAGEVTGGPPPLGQSDRKAFANALDSFLAQLRG